MLFRSLEDYIDSCDLKIDNFIYFNSQLAIEVNEARVRTRSLERSLVVSSSLPKIIGSYFNRLSDFFFAMAVAIERG